jgi:hypothetical protein
MLYSNYLYFRPFNLYINKILIIWVQGLQIYIYLLEQSSTKNKILKFNEWRMTIRILSNILNVNK